jgi:hypothetical protein
VPIAERDFTDGEATELWNALERIATVVRTYEDFAVPVR